MLPISGPKPTLQSSPASVPASPGALTDVNALFASLKPVIPNYLTAHQRPARVEGAQFPLGMDLSRLPPADRKAWVDELTRRLSDQLEVNGYRDVFVTVMNRHFCIAGTKDNGARTGRPTSLSGS